MAWTEITCKSARGPDADRHVKLLIHLAVKGSFFGSDSHLMIFLPSVRFSNGGINAMRAGIRISSLVPSGLVIESVSDSSDSIILAVRSEAGMAECPLCGSRSRRIHSRYDRQVADLPCSGKQIRLRVITRRFVCEIPHCQRRIFAERFGDNVLPTRSRRTGAARRMHRPPFRVGTRRQTSSELCQASDAAGQQRYVASGCTTAGSPTNRSSDRRRRRRLGLSTQSPLRNDCLRSRAAADCNPASRSRGRYSSVLVRGRPSCGFFRSVADCRYGYPY